jgi:hypothetical protein
VYRHKLLGFLLLEVLGDLERIHHQVQAIIARFQLHFSVERDLVTVCDGPDLLAGHADLILLVAWLVEGDVIFAFIPSVYISDERIVDLDLVRHDSDSFLFQCVSFGYSM